MKALKIPTDGAIELIELNGDRLQSYYDHIECRCITSIVPVEGSTLERRFPGVRITGWGDDEGLFVAEPMMNMTAMILFGYPPQHPLVGIWIVTSHNGYGDTTQLPDEVLALAGTADLIDLIASPIYTKVYFAPGRGTTAG